MLTELLKTCGYGNILVLCQESVSHVEKQRRLQ